MSEDFPMVDLGHCHKPLETCEVFLE